MLCSKCKIFSFHLPNYDSYICETGHVLCGTCYDNQQQSCILCGSEIIRQAQICVEGIPTAIFKEMKRKDSACVAESERPDSATGSDEWFCRNPKQFDSDVSYECEKLHLNLNKSGGPLGDNAFTDFPNGRIHSAGNTNVEPRNDFTSKCKNANINIKPSKNPCKLSDTAELCMSFPNMPQQDPKEVYTRFFKGEIDFDPKEDYYPRLTQRKEIEELCRRPELARISSSKTDINKEPTMEPDTTTLTDNLKEFREENNYVNPNNIDVFTLTALPDPLILAKSRTENINNNKNQQPNEIGFTQLGLKEVNENVDVSTMLDLCLEPSLNFANFTANDEEYADLHFKSSQDNRRYVETKNFTEPMRNCPCLLQEQLHSEVYSNFDKHRSQQSNNFITKTNLSCVGECTNQKAFNKLSAPVEISNVRPAISRREELVAQSKKAIREKLLREVYSNFNKKPSASKLVQSKSESSLTKSTSSNNILEENAYIRKSPSPTFSFASHEKKYRSFALSTESYPKLNPDLAMLSVFLSSQTCEQKLQTVPICEKCSDLELEKGASGEKQQPKISESSKFSEGPFIQSTNEFEESTEKMKSTSQFPQDSEFIEENNEAENVVQCIKYPEVITDDLKSKELPENPEVQNDSERTQAMKENTSDTINLKGLKEMLQNMSVKQFRDIILTLPNECDETNIGGAELVNLFINPSNNPPEQKQSDSCEFASTSMNAVGWRAFYSPMPKDDPKAEPGPQYKPISSDLCENAGSAVDSSLNEIRSAADLNIPRSPVTCPLTDCKKLIFVSEFSKHIKVDHAKIPVETIAPGKCKNLFLDPKVHHLGINKCHTLYLVTDKIRDLGSREYKNFLPVLLMSTKVNMMELLSPQYRGIRERQFSLMIWLTGLNPTNMPISISLTAWSRNGPTPKYHFVHSGGLYSIRGDQNAKTLFLNGKVLLISEEECSKLTNYGQNMIELQVVVH